MTEPLKPKKVKVRCCYCGGKGYTIETFPPPNMACPWCGVAGQMIGYDEESRQCYICGKITDTYEAMQQYEKYHSKEEN